MNFFRLEEIPVKFIQAGFLVKVFAGILVGLVYTFYYTDRLTADTFKFFDDSAVIFNALKTNPNHFFRMITGFGAGLEELKPYYNQMNNWYDIYSPFNDNRTMIRFNAVVRFFSMGFYNVHVVFICFLSLTGIVAIIKVFRKEYSRLSFEFYMILLLLPSVLFWGSGLLKDALVYFSFGIMLLTFDKLKCSKFNVANLFSFVGAMLLLLFTKFQVFVLVIPLLIAWWLSKKVRFHPALIFTTVCIIYFGILISPPSILFGGFELTNLLAQKQQAFFVLAQASNAGSAITIPAIKPEPWSILLHAPLGFFNALTRPFLTDVGPILTIISSVENTLILLFGVYSILKFRKANIIGKVIPWFCLFYTVIYFTLIGLITPILGAMVRYKAQALPFLVIMFVIISSDEKTGFIKKLIQKIKSA
jgi:hypothetical protein